MHKDSASDCNLQSVSWFTTVARFGRAGFRKRHLLPILPPGAKLSPNSKIGDKDLGKIPGRYLGNGMWCGLTDWTAGLSSEDWPKALKWPTGNVGLIAEDFPAVDIDVGSSEALAVVLSVVEQQFGQGVAMRTRAGSPRALIPFRRVGEKAIRKHRIVFCDEANVEHPVEVLGEGQQYLVAGIHPSGAEYVWSNDGALPVAADLPPLSAEDAARFIVALQDAIEARGWTLKSMDKPSAEAKARKAPEGLEIGLQSRLDQARVAVEETPIPEKGKQNDALFKLVARLHGIGIAEQDAHTALQAAGWEDVDGFEASVASGFRNAQNEPGSESAEARIASDFGDLDLRTDAERAADAAKAKAQTSYIMGDIDLDGYTKLILDAAANHEAREAVADDDDGGATTEPRRFLTEEDLIARATASSGRARRQQIVQGVLARGDLAVVFGHPSAGKSLFMPYAVRRIGRGEMVFGRKTRKCPVLYIAVEDAPGLEDRVTVLRHYYGDVDGFELDAIASDLRHGKRDHKRVLEWAIKHPDGVIVADTLAMAFPNIDENSTKDMGDVIKACRAWTRVGPAVILIHHETKAGSETPRGSGALYGNADVTIKLTKDERTRVVTGKLGKNRNGSPDWRPAFKIEVQEFGTDEWGDPRTVAYAREVDAPADPKEEFDDHLSVDAKQALIDAIASGYDRCHHKAAKYVPKAPGLLKALGHDEATVKTRKAVIDLCDELADKGILRKEIETIKGDKQEFYAIADRAKCEDWLAE